MFVVVVLVVVVRHVDVLVVELVLGLPRHLVLLLQPATGVGEPRAHLKTFILILSSINKQ